MSESDLINALNDLKKKQTNANTKMNKIEPQEITIDEAVKMFLSTNKVKIIIGTPCYGGLLHTGYFQSMIEMTSNFIRLGIHFEVMTIGNESLITRARN